MFGCFYKNELENKMPGMTIENIAAACEGTFVGDRDLVTKEIAGAVTDSRQVQKDYLFIPIKGARVDGHDFIPQVFEKGALVGAVAFLDGQPVTVLADVKGKDFAECARRNYGMPMPEGYRKALRLMKQAEKFNRPIISFVNTPGAFCGVEAEERGQGEAIARNLLEMSALKVPVLCILIGEGGSGGALATAVGNEVWMMENATYSILSPEGFASILWKDADRAREASEVMNITSEDLKRLGVIERIVPEYGGADQSTVEAIGGYLKEHIKEFLQKYTGMTGEQIAEERYERFRKY